MVNLDIDIPEVFFYEEKRCGYIITSKQKEVWAVELDLLNKFTTVCEKYHLSYFAESGTLLGAVRHGGFIPWDDDIDVVMPRKDYSLLCDIAEKEFAYPYFYQTEETDPGTIRGHAQLRNSRTTGILKEEYDKRYSFNQGIFIDIFPLDVLPPAKNRILFFETIKELKEKSWEFAMTHQRIGNYKKINKYYLELEQFCQMYNITENPKKIGTLEFSGGRRDMIRTYDDYIATIEVPFEFLNISIPIGYKRVLMDTYGKWKRYVIGVSGHGGTIFDTNRSYLEVLKGEK